MKKITIIAIVVVALVTFGCSADNRPSETTGADAAAEAPDAFPLIGEVATLSGNGEQGLIDGDRSTARFSNPVSVVAISTNEMVVADFDSNSIRLVTSEGQVTTLKAPDNFTRPFGLAYKNNEVFIETDDNDIGEHSYSTGTIWRLDLRTGDYSVIKRNIGRPRGLAFHTNGLLVMSDRQHHVIRTLNVVTGEVQNVAGKFDVAGNTDARGDNATFNSPRDIVITDYGSILVADTGNDTIREVTLDGDVTTYIASNVGIKSPVSLAYGGSTLIIGDSSDARLYTVTSDSNIELLAGSYPGYEDGQYTDSLFFGIEGMTVMNSYLYIADGTAGDDGPYNRVRRVKL